MSQLETRMSITNTLASVSDGPAGYALNISVFLGGEYGWSRRVPLAEVPTEILTLNQEQFLAHPWTAPLVAEAKASLMPRLDAHLASIAALKAEFDGAA